MKRLMHDFLRCSSFRLLLLTPPRSDGGAVACVSSVGPGVQRER